MEPGISQMPCRAADSWNASSAALGRLWAERLLGRVGQALGVLGQRAIGRQLAEQDHLNPGIDAHQNVDLMAHGGDVFRQAGDVHLHAGDREGGHSRPLIRQHGKNK
jgi:hypothetical protein